MDMIVNNNACKYTNAYNRGKNGILKIVDTLWHSSKDKIKKKNKRIILSRAGIGLL
jgi:hypothetical protein